MAQKHRVYSMSFGKIYPLYIEKAENKGRTKREVDKILRWLTGYTQRQINAHTKKETDVETFINEAPEPHPNRKLITGVVCGVRVEEVKEKTMRELRYMDKLIDELAKGKDMKKILREG